MLPLRRFRRPYRQLNDIERGRIVGMSEPGWSYRAIGRHLRHTNTAVQSLFTTPMVPSIISRGLAEAWFRSQWPLRRLPLTTQHRRNRLEWYCSQSSWLPSDWHRIEFNESSHQRLATLFLKQMIVIVSDEVGASGFNKPLFYKGLQ
ncbi:hypothetical protein TNCV_3013871 [Trichonephila clavipes]|nr:hypothetical protein TNCV_3013871 [Trichonephila clavipes]